jgi:hypothetical protein
MKRQGKMLISECKIQNAKEAAAKKPEGVSGFFE